MEPIPAGAASHYRPSRIPNRLIGSVRAAIIIILTIAGPAVADSPTSDLPTSAGSHDLEFPLADGQRLRYTLNLPHALPRDGSQTLVLVLHYGGPPSGFYGRPLIEGLIAPGLSGLDALFVAPVTLGGDWKSTANESAVMALYDVLEKHYATDSGFRVITGYSMGAAGTWHFISRYAGFFSAAIPISGFERAAKADCGAPIYALHSTADSIFDADSLRDTVASLTAEGCDVRVSFIEGVDHFDIPAFKNLLHDTLPWLREVRAQAEGSSP